MNQHIEDARRQLGELAAMAAQTEAMEQTILARAEALLADIEGNIDAVRNEAMVGNDASKKSYTNMVHERGRLQQVIAHSRQMLDL